MNGLLLYEQTISAALWTVLGCFISYYINKYTEEKILNNIDNSSKKREITLLLIAEITFALVIIVIVTFIGFKFAIFAGGLMFITAFIYAIQSLYKFLFTRSDKITWSNHMTLNIAIISWLFFTYFPIIFNVIASFSFSLELLSDFLITITLMIWYTLSIFFVFSNLLITLNCFVKTLNLYKKFENIFTRAKRLLKSIKKPNATITKYEDIFKIEQDILFKFINTALYYICFSVDVIIFVINNMIYIICESTIMILLQLLNILKLTCSFFDYDIGRKIAISFRLAIVCSFLTIYIYNIYNSILSDSGGKVFEFICSVIVIPIILSEINEMREYRR